MRQPINEYATIPICMGKIWDTSRVTTNSFRNSWTLVGFSSSVDLDWNLWYFYTVYNQPEEEI